MNLTRSQFCKQAGISVRTLDNLRAAGAAPIITRIGKRVFVSEENAATWLKSREEPPAKALSSDTLSKA